MKKSISLLLVIVMLVTILPCAAFAEGGSNMKASDQIISIIESFEGFSPTPYRGSGEEFLTIGYGHYGEDVTEDMEMTQQEADALFRSEMAEYESYVNNFFNKHNLKYSQQVFDAVLSLTYNIGTSWMNNSSYRIRNYLINGLDKYSDVEIADAMGVICTSGGSILPGLINRRIKEARIMLYGDYSGTSSPDFVYLILNANGGTLSDNDNGVKIYSKGQPYGTLPGAYKKNYVLSAWQTPAGVTIKASDIASQSLSVKAIWTSGNVKKYNLTVSGGTGSGSYAAGETVTIKPTGSSFLAWKSGDVRIISSGGNYSFKMPAYNLTISTVDDYDCSGKTCPAAGFTDVGSNYWAHREIDFVCANNLFKGCSETEFLPAVTMTRGMLMTVLYRLCGSPSVSGIHSSFSDVPSNVYYCDAVAWAHHNCIGNGYPDGTFRPNDTLTREQLATFLLRYANTMGYDTGKYANISGFTDVGFVSAFADEAFCWAVANGIINGTSATTLSPTDGAARAQVAAMITRFVKNVAAGANVQKLT